MRRTSTCWKTRLGRCPEDTSSPSLGAVVGAAPHSTPHWLPFGITKCTKRGGRFKISPHILYNINIWRTLRHRVKGGKQQGASAFARADSSVTPSLLSRKLGAVNFSNFGNARIDVKSSWSSPVCCATIKWVQYSDSTSKGGSDRIGRGWHPAARLTRHFEGRRQCLSDEKWLISSLICPMKSTSIHWKELAIFHVA